MDLLHLYNSPTPYLILAACLFGTGLFGLLCRRTLIGMLISGEIIFAAASVNIMTLNRFHSADPAAGQVFVLFIMGLAAAEVAIALSIIIAVYRNFRSIIPENLGELKG